MSLVPKRLPYLTFDLLSFDGDQRSSQRVSQQWSLDSTRSRGKNGD
jgi:hypothetical protein